MLVSSTGARLLDPGAEAAYREALFPHALVVTPNTREAAALLGATVDTLADAREAARRSADWGPAWVVVKGGHLVGDGAPATWCSRRRPATSTELCLPRVATRNDHGTGCTFAAATAAGLARGGRCPWPSTAAKRFVHEGLARVGRLARWAAATARSASSAPGPERLRRLDRPACGPAVCWSTCPCDGRAEQTGR